MYVHVLMDVLELCPGDNVVDVFFNRVDDLEAATGFLDFAGIFGQEFLDVSKDGVGFDNVGGKGEVRCAYDVVVQCFDVISGLFCADMFVSFCLFYEKAVRNGC